MASPYDFLNPNTFYPPPYGEGYGPGNSPYSLSNWGTGTPKSMGVNALQMLMPSIMPQGIDTSYTGVKQGNIDLNNFAKTQTLKPNQKVEDGYIVGKNAPIGLLGAGAGLVDATLGLFGIKTDLDQQGTRRKGQISSAGFGGKAPTGYEDWTDGSTNVNNFTGSSTPTPQDQMSGLAYEQRALEARYPYFQRALEDIRKNNLATFQGQMAAQAPWLQWSAAQAPAQQSRMFGASKGNYYNRLGMAAMADAAKWAAQTPRAFGRQGTPTN